MQPHSLDRFWRHRIRRRGFHQECATRNNKRTSCRGQGAITLGSVESNCVFLEGEFTKSMDAALPAAKRSSSSALTRDLAHAEGNGPFTVVRVSACRAGVGGARGWRYRYRSGTVNGATSHTCDLSRTHTHTPKKRTRLTSGSFARGSGPGPRTRAAEVASGSRGRAAAASLVPTRVRRARVW